MELRDLTYFLTIAREGSITGAANALHLSQPALTRQLKALEEELKTQLIVRGNRRITLTEEGMLLRRRAEDLLRLAERTKAELLHPGDAISGEITICAGETEGLSFLTKAAKRLMDRHPQVQLHISSGDTGDVLEELEKGLIDFGLLFDPIDATKYNHLPLPYADTWGILSRKDAPLAEKAAVGFADLAGEPVIVPRVAYGDRRFLSHGLRIVGTYSLLFNASLMVRDGIGYALALDKILNLTGDSALCFIPFSPETKATMHVVWRRNQRLSKAAQALLAELSP